MSKNWLISRRTVLRGLGASVALPLLEQMIPTRALAASLKPKAPVRMGFIYTPNGAIMSDWKPTKVGKDFDLPPTLQALAKVKDRITVVTGLGHENGKSGRDGAGDHARANATFLTGARPYKTAGADIHLGVSVDQFAAQQIGDNTRLPSLELTCDKGRSAGACDSGYSCAYQMNLSWRTDTTPVPAEYDPAQVFNRLFGSGDMSPAGRAARLARRKSVLDLVAEDAKQLQAKLGKNDQRKLDEYTTSVREIEKRIEKARLDAQQAAASNQKGPELVRPEGVPKEASAHLRLMYDLMVLAYQTDQTRIVTFMTAHDGSNRNFPEIGVTEGHHELSHHRNETPKIDALKKIDRFYHQQLAYFLEKMKATPEGDSNLLDNSMIVFGSSLSDANRHQHDDLPIIVAGRAGGAINSGRHLQLKSTPMCNLYLQILDIAGVKADRFGDSTGRLSLT
jgi:hypothetical protein